MIIDIGTKVTFKLNGRIRICTIVHSGESNPIQGKISSDAPLAKIMLGKKEDDVARGHVPAGEVTIEIIKVEKALTYL